MVSSFSTPTLVNFEKKQLASGPKQEVGQLDKSSAQAETDVMGKSRWRKAERMNTDDYKLQKQGSVIDKILYW